MHSKTDIENVYLMAAGPIPPNPAELLGSRAMDEALLEAYNMFDIILIDTPPVLAVTDAQILANKCDGIVLVVRSEKTEKDKIVKAKQILDKASGKILGVVLNDKREEKSSMVITKIETGQQEILVGFFVFLNLFLKLHSIKSMI